MERGRRHKRPIFSEKKKNFRHRQRRNLDATVGESLTRKTSGKVGIGLVKRGGGPMGCGCVVSVNQQN